MIVKINRQTLKIPPNCPFFNTRCGKPYFSVSWSTDNISKLSLSKALKYDDLGPVICSIAHCYWWKEADRIQSKIDNISVHVDYHDILLDKINALDQAERWAKLICD